jgi:hypothetical protein
MRGLWLAVGLWACGASACHAASALVGVCSSTPTLTARQQDQLLRFAAIVKQELDDSGQALALVSRSGLNLQRFGARYSHAGVSLKASENTPWSVRQLYYACDEHRPRLYDQGLAGFVFGSEDPALGYVSIVLLPAVEAAALERAALDKARALRLLAATYSANAYAYSLRYQNCNQWVMELLAAAWGGLADADDLRARAQAWLREQGYAPQPLAVNSHWLMFAATFAPWFHVDDHPQEDLYALQFRISMPATIEAFVRERVPGAERIELCHNAGRVVIHRGWQPVAEGCQPGADDRVIVLD